MNFADELIAMTDDGREINRRLQGVTQCAAQAANMNLEIVLVDMHLRPGECDQVVLADFFACTAHQEVEDVQRPPAEFDRSIAVEEDLLTRDQTERSEHESNVHKRLVSHSPLLSPWYRSVAPLPRLLFQGP